MSVIKRPISVLSSRVSWWWVLLLALACLVERGSCFDDSNDREVVWLFLAFFGVPVVLIIVVIIILACKYKHLDPYVEGEGGFDEVECQVIQSARREASVKSYVRMLNQPQASPFAPILPSGRYCGKYTECGVSSVISYELVFFKDGRIRGHVGGSDGTFKVKGHWSNGVCRWAETHPDAKYTSLRNPQKYADAVLKGDLLHVEVEMRISRENPRKLEGQYFASTGLSGDLTLWFDDAIRILVSSSESERDETDSLTRSPRNRNGLHDQLQEDLNRELQNAHALLWSFDPEDQRQKLLKQTARSDCNEQENCARNEQQGDNRWDNLKQDAVELGIRAGHALLDTSEVQKHHKMKGKVQEERRRAAVSKDERRQEHSLRKVSWNEKRGWLWGRDKKKEERKQEAMSQEMRMAHFVLDGSENRVEMRECSIKEQRKGRHRNAQEDFEQDQIEQQMRKAASSLQGPDNREEGDQEDKQTRLSGRRRRNERYRDGREDRDEALVEREIRESHSVLRGYSSEGEEHKRGSSPFAAVKRSVRPGYALLKKTELKTPFLH